MCTHYDVNKAPRSTGIFNSSFQLVIYYPFPGLWGESADLLSEVVTYCTILYGDLLHIEANLSPIL